MAAGAFVPAIARKSIWQRALGRDWKLGWVLLIPILIVLLGLIAYPFVLSIYLSFTDKMIGKPANFVGLQNYRDVMFGAEFGEVFWKSVINTILYTVAAVGCKALLGMGMALFLH
ncbi:MAG: sugar ABC transporter permease, partial [Candidatus Dormibacteraceae bacterium]